jgi:hypothetical protein
MITTRHLKTFAVLFFAMLCLSKVNAQDSVKVNHQEEVRSLNKIRLNLLGLTFEREQKIGKLTTLYAGAGVAATFLVQGKYDFQLGTSTTETYFDLTPNIYGGVRKYYHFERRKEKGKKTINNSSNYYGLDVSSYFNPLFDENNIVKWEIAITPNWGIQRSVGKRVNFELMLGPTVRINEFETYYGVDGRIGFSFLL